MTALDKHNEPAEQGEPISRQAVIDAFAALGLEANISCLLELVAEPWGITVTTYRLDEYGNRFCEYGDQVAKLRTYYPIEG